MHGHYIGDPQVYRTKEDRDEAAERDPIVRLREKLEVMPEEWAALEDEVAGVVETAVEFARNGTDPQPEDALKNIYA
jgi:pyruvate dehydrogenase E1 component alpha subunit